MKSTPRVKSLPAAAGSPARTNCGRKVMKKSTIFGLRRLIASPRPRSTPRPAAAGGRSGRRQGRAVADRLHREPGEVERARHLQREERRRRRHDQRREPERHQHGVHQDPGAGAGERRQPGGTALGERAAEEEGHVRAGRQRDHDDREREGHEHGRLGQHRRRSAAALGQALAHVGLDRADHLLHPGIEEVAGALDGLVGDGDALLLLQLVGERRRRRPAAPPGRRRRR